MTNSIEPFDFSYSGKQVRTVVINDDPWFVAADVCAVLEIGNPRQAVSYLDEDEVQQVPVTTNDGSARVLPTNIISEPGLYSLIMRSRKPEARAFKRWVIHEVLPSIRKTGAYAVQPQRELTRVEMAEMLLEAERAREKLAVDLMVAEAQKKALAAGRSEDAPKVFAYHTLMDSTGTVSVAEAAQIINVPGTGQNNFFKLLRDQGIIIPGKTRPYQQYIDRGWFVMRAGRGKPTTDGWEKVDTTRVTPKGLEALARIFKSQDE